jgi:hypothetical protein
MMGTRVHARPRARLLGLCLCALVLGCQSAGSGSPPGCPVVPAEPTSLSPDYRGQGALRVAQTTLGFAVERDGDTLTIVGFTPFGTRAFAIRQKGTSLKVDDFVGERMGVEPLWLADALHRAFFIAEPNGAQVVRDSVDPAGPQARRWSWRDATVTDYFKPNGRRVARQFNRGEIDSAEVAIIRYTDAEGTGAEVYNPWCGYHGRIVLREQRPQDEGRSE